MYYTSIISFIIMGLCWLYLERRRFLRMSSGGVEEFDSYFGLWKSRIFELIIKIIMLISGVVGVMRFILEYK